MITTYNEILNNMKNAFFEKYGESVELFSDLNARFEAVSSELYSLACYADFVLKQTFPQTATGEYLALHASLRDIRRKEAAKADGKLTFYIDEPLEEALEIPSGIICTIEDAPYIQFETTQGAVIPAGGLQVSVNARATQTGAAHNVHKNTITVMVTPPEGVSRVNNSSEFSGGYDGESDSALRSRILSSYSIPQTGLSRSSLSEIINKFDDVLDSNVDFVDDTANAYVRTKSGDISATLFGELYDALSFAELLGYTLNIEAAEEVPCTVKISLSAPSQNREDVKNEAVKIINDAFCALKVGESMKLNRLAYALSEIDGVKYCEAESSQADRNTNTIYCASNQCLTFYGAEVQFYAR